MKTLIWDLESDGLLNELTTIHSLVLQDFDTQEVWSCHDQGGYPTIEDGLKMLMAADRICGHNIISFDIPAVRKIYPWFEVDQSKVFDTLVASRLIWPNLKDEDFKAAKLPAQMCGRHGLESWGLRLDNWKGDYSKECTAAGIDPWAKWSENMQDYCEQDVAVNTQLYDLILSKNYGEDALRLENDVQFILAAQERKGVLFDIPKAEALVQKLRIEHAKVQDEMASLFKPWNVVDKIFTPKVNNKKLGYTKGEEVTKMKTVVFNPNSRDHIANRLTAIHGWKPTKFTGNGKPKVDEDVLSELPYDEAQRLVYGMLVGKRLSQLADGRQAWLSAVKEDGRIYGRINPNGTITRRASHHSPNLGQVPKVGKPFGAECRELFMAPRDRRLVGVDASGLELRMLAHYLARHDQGAYARELLEGDVHALTSHALGISRDDAKTFSYALLYGAGNQKLGSIVGKGARAGGMLRKKFLHGIPAFKKLTDGVSAASKKGWIMGLDGGAIQIRHQHAALNSLLQSAGAIVCKKWMCVFHEKLKMGGLDAKVDQVLWVHDEIQMEVDPDVAEVVGQLCAQSVTWAGEQLNMRIPLAGEYIVGDNWKDTH